MPIRQNWQNSCLKNKFIFSERTTLYGVLSGVGIVFFPLMEFVGGQLYKYTGFYGVFGTSLGFTVAGIAYIVVIPETVTKREGFGFNSDRGR